MNRCFEGKVALVTGGGSGIGRAVALRLLVEGACVLIADYNTQAAEETLELARGLVLESRLAVMKADVASEADNASMVATAAERFGRLDLAILNAGVGGAFGPLADTRVEEWDYTFSVLTRGVFLGIKHSSIAMRNFGRGGAIVVTASIAGLIGGAGSHAYSAAKAATISLTKSAAVELAAYRIRVNAVAPGAISTPMLHRGKPDRLAAVLSRAPWPERGEPEHVSGVVAFLCSEDASFMTGETVVADGGLIAQGVALFGAGLANTMLRHAGVDRGSTGEEGDFRRSALP